MLKTLVHFVPRTHVSLDVEWLTPSPSLLPKILAEPPIIPLVLCCLMLPIPFLVSTGLHLFLFLIFYLFLYQSSYETDSLTPCCLLCSHSTLSI